MIKKGSRIKVKKINKDYMGYGKIYPETFGEMVGAIGTVTRRKNTGGFVEVDLDEHGPHWAFLREDLEVID